MQKNSNNGKMRLIWSICLCLTISAFCIIFRDPADQQSAARELGNALFEDRATAHLQIFDGDLTISERNKDLLFDRVIRPEFYGYWRTRLETKREGDSRASLMVEGANRSGKKIYFGFSILKSNEGGGIKLLVLLEKVWMATSVQSLGRFPKTHSEMTPYLLDGVSRMKSKLIEIGIRQVLGPTGHRMSWDELEAYYRQIGTAMK